MPFNPIYFSSPSGAPGPKVKILLSLPKTTFHITIGKTKVNFRGNRSPEFLERDGVSPVIFYAPQVKAQSLWLAEDIIKAQRQFKKTSYPDIYRERFVDLTHRDKNALKALGSWDDLSADEAEKLRKGMMAEMGKTQQRWRELREDLVAWSVRDISEPSSAGQMKVLFSPDEDTELVHAQLDEAYMEYKRIQASIYEDAPVLSQSGA